MGRQLLPTVHEHIEDGRGHMCVIDVSSRVGSLIIENFFNMRLLSSAANF